jgi:hypothetical protein
MLNIANNNLGVMVAPSGWALDRATTSPGGAWQYRHADGRTQNHLPGGSRQVAFAALAIALAKSAMATVNISNNKLGAEGALHILGVLEANQ